MADPIHDPQQQTAYHSQNGPSNSNSDTGAALASGGPNSDPDNHYVPRPKRIACVLCRKRKLRCDGKKPSCGTCSRLGHECAYEEVRKKSGPKRGYVKQLEARLAQVETLLKTQERSPPQNQGNNELSGFEVAAPNEFTSVPEINTSAGEAVDAGLSPPTGESGPLQLEAAAPSNFEGSQSEGYWEMVSLGLEEPIPHRQVIDELNQIFFDKIHPPLPVIHRPRHLAAMNLAPRVRPPICLQYITWSLAASVSDKYFGLHSLFYQRARKYSELEEMKGLGEGIVSVAYCQTWLLIATYEFRMMFFPRAWLSVGKAARLALMMGLNRLDGPDLEIKKSLPPARDWTEKEERRRTFWLTFCVDRYASVGTGWPVVIDERDISTNLPATEEAFIKSKPQRTLRLGDIFAGEGLSTLSPCASIAFMACLFGRNLAHLHRPEPQDNDYDLNGLYWQRHRSHDNILLHFTLSMPNHLRLPAGVGDPNVIFCNMAIHTSTICLHQAAIFKAERNKMPEQIITESKRRCIVAADQISNTMKMISHMDLTTMNPFMSFCIFVAARVFVQYLKSRPDDFAARSSLQFLFSALEALKYKNPLTESFLVQLDVDVQGTSFSDLRQPRRTSPSHQVQAACAEEITDCPILMPLNRSAKQHSDPSSQTVPRHSYHMPPSLTPSGRAHAMQQLNTNNGDAQHLNTPPYNLSAGSEPTGTGIILDMDLAQDLNGHSHSHSHSHSNSNPGTTLPADPALNTSTTSFLPQGSTEQSTSTAPKRHQQQHPSLNTPNHQNPNNPNPYENTNPSLDTSTPEHFLGTRMFPGLMTPLDSGSDSSIPIPSTWDFNVAAQNGEDIDIAPHGMDSLNETQWAQILSSTGWDTWRGQG